MIRNRKFSFAIIVLLFSCTLHAKLFQILHTNDVHGYMDNTEHTDDLGGYGQLKTLIAKERAWAKARGIETLAMDAGDYLEGNIYYMANRGKTLYQVHGSVGFDAVTIGNHDYLMGTQDLNAMLRDTNTDFQLLGANVYVEPQWKSIRDKMKPYKIFNIGGLKIGVLGITTKDILYTWRLTDAKVTNEKKAARKYARILKNKHKVDAVIALTHIGVSKDKKIAKKVPEIDVIVGGHSHTSLFEPVFQKSKKGKRIPIVQAGSHGKYLGKLIVDIDENGGGVQVVHYELLPVRGYDRDAGVEDLITLADHQINELYGKSWLEEVLGYSELQPSDSSKIWGHFITDSLRESSNGHFAVHTQALSGPDFPIGNITRRKLFNSNPRVFEFDRPEGYHVYSSYVRGFWIKNLFRVVMRFGIPLYITGLDFKYTKTKSGKYKVKKLRINGKRINPFKHYKIGLSEAIVRGGLAITPLVKLLLKRNKRHQISMWEALENKVVNMSTVPRTYLQDTFFNSYSTKEKVQGRLFVPAANY